MDQSSSGEELVIKTRKPYTITKQRERWTEEEHNKFLEAIKLYGRSWQRIEEHIGTKTAVQIRSHAQKFFSKLEKEALEKGVPVGQALDIDIPPPRPKRKPSNPYPRKSSVVVPMSQVGEKDGENLISASSHCKQGLRLEKEPLPERSEVFITFQEHRCSSAHSANLNFRRAHVGLNGPCTSKEMPSQKEKNQERGTNEVPSFEISMPLDEKSDRDKKEDDFTGAVATEKIPASNNPRNVPDNIVYRSLDASMETPLADTSCKGPLLKPASNGHGYPNLLMNPSASTNTSNPNYAPRSIYHSLSVLSPFIAANHNRDDYHKFLDMSSTFSSLVVSSLLQNPAAHAAASFAASFWPHANLDHSSGSPGCTQCGYLPTQMEYPPSMASIAAATVAAATAWWAAHGLLPLCTPLHSVLGCSPAPAVPSTDTGHARSSKTGRIDNTSQNFTLQDQPLNEQCEALQALQLASKSHTVTSKGSEEDGSVNRDGREKVAIPEKDLAATELQVSDKAKAGKQVERSSSGSNTPSGSEVEADAQKKYGKDYTREPEHDYTNGESWKKVSEEGKLAFRELFSRDVLPQSFSSAHDQRNAGLGKKTDDDTQKAGKMSSDAKLLNLNSKTNGFSDCKQAVGKETKHDDGNRESGLMTIGLANGKLKKCWTGFKPYKRCSVEAKESRPKVTSTQGVEKGPKRTRLEEEAST